MNQPLPSPTLPSQKAAASSTLGKASVQPATSGQLLKPGQEIKPAAATSQLSNLNKPGLPPIPKAAAKPSGISATVAPPTTLAPPTLPTTPAKPATQTQTSAQTPAQTPAPSKGTSTGANLPRPVIPNLNRPLPAGLSEQAPGGSIPQRFTGGPVAGSTVGSGAYQPTKSMSPLPAAAKLPANVAPPAAAPKPVTFAGSTSINAPSGGRPVLAKANRFPTKLIGIVVLVLAIVGAAFFVFNKFFSSSKTQQSATIGPANSGQQSSGQTGTSTAAGKGITLVYWGLFEEPAVMEGVLKDFEAAHKGVTIDYRKQSHKDYRERLQTAIASSSGPDVFRFHASWTPMLKNELAVMPNKTMSLAEFQKTFYPVATSQLQLNGQIIGLPMMYDGLALFYNKEILKTAGAQPPTSWRELQILAKELTSPKDRTADTLTRGGLAIGNATNVEHFAEIIGLLIYQNGGDPANPNSVEVRDALVYYTNFVKNDLVYSEKLPSSTVAFARGEVAMMLAPSWRAHEVLAMNPKLDFGIVAAPKLADRNVAWGSYWAEGVSNKSKNQEMAWELLKYLTSKEVMLKLYSAQKQVRAFGEIYSRVDLAAELSSDPYAAAFLQDAPNAKSWYMNSYTHDNGLNDENIKYYQDAVNAILAGQDIEKVLATLDLAVKQNIKQYGVGETKK